MLKKIRNNLGLQTKFVAKELGISSNYLSQLENGKGSMPKERLDALAQLYKTDVNIIRKAWEELHYEYMGKRMSKKTS